MKRSSKIILSVVAGIVVITLTISFYAGNTLG
ncbi:hypothetical protein SAMN05192535_1977 [Shouchella rhizosphaerae]|nr:hypothetical protein SAMN05192535_1977 [Shouchella rhizosphaerae]